MCTDGGGERRCEMVGSHARMCEGAGGAEYGRAWSCAARRLVACVLSDRRFEGEG